MSYLEGFISGFGKSAKEQSDNMLATQLKKYESASRIWQAMAQDPGYHHTIREQFLKNAQDLAMFDPSDRTSILRAREIAKLDPNKEATRAYDAMRMLNMNPEETKYFDSSGYMGPTQEYQRKIDLTTSIEKTKAELEAQARQAKVKPILDAIDQMFGGQPPASGAAPQSSQLQEQQRKALTLAALMGSSNVGNIINPTQVGGGIVFQDQTGQMNTTPGVMFAGQTYAPTPTGPQPTQPIAHGTDVRLTQGAGGQQFWAAPGITPQNAGQELTRQPIQSTTVSQEDPINLQRRTVTSRSYPGGTPAAAGSVQPAPGLSPPPSAATPIDTAPTPKNSTPIAPPDMGGPQKQKYDINANYTWPDKVDSPPGKQKAALNPVAIRKYQASEKGVEHVDRIVNKVEDFIARFGTSPTGPITGRIQTWLNKIGWAEAMNEIAKIGAQYDSGQLSEPDAAARLDRINSTLSQQAKSIIGEGDAAEEFAGLITLTRSLNGLELIAMSGSGNGITRLYEMMNTALLNPYQSPTLLRGHAREVAFLFATTMAGNMELEGRGWPNLKPKTRAALEKLQLGDNIPGYDYWAPVLGDGTTPKQTATNNTATPKTVTRKQLELVAKKYNKTYEDTEKEYKLGGYVVVDK